LKNLLMYEIDRKKCSPEYFGWSLLIWSLFPVLWFELYYQHLILPVKDFVAGHCQQTVRFQLLISLKIKFCFLKTFYSVNKVSNYQISVLLKLSLI
jgi:hypothetical protein